MEFLNTENLTPKTSRSASPVNAAIRKTIMEIPEGKSIRLADLTAELAEEFNMKKAQVSARVGVVLQQKSFERLQRFTDAQGKTCIGLPREHEVN